jgi:hypothetical protein
MCNALGNDNIANGNLGNLGNSKTDCQDCQWHDADRWRLPASA